MKQQNLLQQLRREVAKLASKEKAAFVSGFFKTGKGQYGEGDVFVGLTVPQSRDIAKKYKDFPFKDVETLLQSEIHEERLIALLILVAQFQKADPKEQNALVDFYLAHTKYINNWDLVDLSADKIVGEYLYSSRKERSLAKGGRSDNSLDLLKTLAKSPSLWERRIAMISTYAFIKNGKSDEAITIATLLLHDKNDLIQKAVGWMLREVGKRVSREDLKNFLTKHKHEMGRTALRYAIEHFSEEERKKYLLRKK
ncbi:MAG: DNA alkylation repair protein [Candidatus Levybacteria bacterium]|nr:DNA alkylation repair protein [Candidatus Levybacteria bacterium]